MKQDHKVYPSKGIDSIKSQFNPLVYLKSKDLHNLLRKIIFKDPNI